MKCYLSAIFLILFFFSNINAQETVTFGELTPYTKWLANEIERNKGIHGEFFKSRKFNANFKIKTEVMEGQEDAVIVKIETSSDDLDYFDKGGIMTSMMRYFGRITSTDFKFDSAFEEIIKIKEIPADKWTEIFPNLKTSSVIYQRAFKLPKGKYTVNFAIDNRGSKEAKKKIKFEIK